MKTNVRSIIAITALTLAFLAFKRPDQKAKISAVRSIMTQGKWKVNLYRDNGLDETNNYTGYELEFKPNGTVIASKAEQLISGSWKNAVDKQRTKLYIEFTSASHLDELSEDWVIRNQQNDSLELEDLATGHGGIDYLNLQKIS